MASTRRSSERSGKDARSAERRYEQFRESNTRWHGKIEKSVQRIGRNGKKSR